MKTITMDVLKDAANRLLFDMSEDQYKTLYEEFGILTKQMEKIGEIKGSWIITPDDFPLSTARPPSLREDVAEEPLPRDEALKNAGNKQDNQIKLPKVVL
jgi:aspartyl/glutamyl-tRNA(Asn/Gln) amidotransferase C subunit